MLKIKSTDKDREDSRGFEMITYLNSMKAMYVKALKENALIYDEAFDLTDRFKKINATAIISDSRIIKTFRYAIAPAISQMKFGQFFGFNSIDRFEEERVVRGVKLDELKVIAPQIAKFINDNIDKSRFVWLNDSRLQNQQSFDFAKKWTCGIAADQNAQTAYRNWRKDQQEKAIVDALIASGYVKSSVSSVILAEGDIGVGEYTSEIRVKGRTIQKADVVFRNKKTNKLTLVEAKAVGVELDATKRIKECCDKANDWRSSPRLNSPDIIAVIAGFFNPNNIANLQASDIAIAWEHKLGEFKKVI